MTRPAASLHHDDPNDPVLPHSTNLWDEGRLWRRAWWRWQRPTIVPTIAAVVLIVLVTLSVIVFMPRTYRSTARLLIRPGRESVTLDPTVAATGQAMPLQQTRQNEVETALGVMRSRLLLESVATSIGADAILNGSPTTGEEPRSGSLVGGILASARAILASARAMIGRLDPVPATEQAIRVLSKQLDVSAIRDSSVIEIEYRTADPELARSVVDAFVRAFLAQQGEFEQSSAALEFFSREQSRLTEELARAHHALRDVKDQAGLVTVQGQQLLLETELADVRMQQNLVDSELAASESRAEELTRQLTRLDSRAVIEESSGTSDSGELMRARLFDLEVIEQDLASRYRDNHPRLMSTRRQLSETRAYLDGYVEKNDEIIRGINPTFQRIETERALESALRDSLRRKRETILAQVQALHLEIEVLNRHAESIAQKTRDVDVLESQYLTHSERLEQARIADMLQREQIHSIREIQPASLEQRPIAPNKMLCVVLGLFATGCAVVGIPLMLGRESTRDRLLPAVVSANLSPGTSSSPRVVQA